MAGIGSRVGWWFDSETCMGCDVDADSLGHFDYVDFIPFADPNHVLHVIVCDQCTKQFFNAVSETRRKIENRMAMVEKYNRCQMYFRYEPKPGTGLVRIYSRS